MLPDPHVSDLRARFEVFRQYMLLKHLPLVTHTDTMPFVKPLSVDQASASGEQLLDSRVLPTRPSFQIGFDEC